jgi:hypothetical protein
MEVAAQVFFHLPEIRFIPLEDFFHIHGHAFRASVAGL